MAIFVLDSFAMLAFFRDEQGAAKVAQLLNDAANNKHELYMTTINAGEVFYMSYRKDGTAKAEIAWKALLQFPIHIINADMEFTLAAARLKARFPLSYADAFAAVLTIKRKAILITSDKEFDALIKESGFKVKYL
jgi:predicted nucleic acid-binding protein